MGKPSLLVTPLKSNIDEDIDIIISGCGEAEEVSVITSIYDDRNEHFESDVTFKADSNGEVDLAKAAPVRGTYSGVDQTGIFWSAIHKKKRHDDYFLKSNASELNIRIQLKTNDDIVDEAEITRSFYPEHVKATTINEDGTVGTLYQPKQDGTYPNVILLAGADGGKLDPAASLLASKGFNVFDIAYFNQEGVSKNLESIPLEYFYEAIQLMKKRTANDGKVTMIGYSKGAELALLLASEYDEFSAVIAGAPGAYITSGMKNSIFAPIPSWTLNNETKPYLKFQHKVSNMLPLFKQMILRRPASFDGIWKDSMSRLEELEEMRIKVEKIQAPVLLVSGDQDRIWPSSIFAGVIKKHLNGAEHLRYEHGGHFVAFPYALPHVPSNIYEHAGGGVIMDSGGTKEANAQAARHSFPLILDFIKKHSG